MGRRGPLPWLAPGVLVGALAPAVAIVLRARFDRLGANPIAEALNELGLTAFILLIASLAATPLKTVCGWTWPIRIRRMVGLLAFGYAVLHVTVYVVLDQSIDWKAIVDDVTKRNFILVGFAALLLLLPLAATSSDAAVRRLGFVQWKRLHRVVYAAALLASIHFIWRVKRDRREPFAYAAVLAVLLLVRVVSAYRRAPPRAETAPPALAAGAMGS